MTDNALKSYCYFNYDDLKSDDQRVGKVFERSRTCKICKDLPVVWARSLIKMETRKKDTMQRKKFHFSQFLLRPSWSEDRTISCRRSYTTFVETVFLQSKFYSCGPLLDPKEFRILSIRERDKREEGRDTGTGVLRVTV